MEKSRNWCFTLNNYSEEDEKKLSDMGQNIRYIGYGREVGESGTPHLQGMIIYKNAVRFGTLKQFLPNAHFEIMNGTFEQNLDYCSKDGNFVEYGNFSKKSK